MRQRELLREHANLLVVPAQACAAGERIVEEVDDSKDESDSDDDGQLRAEVARRAAPRKVSSVVAPQESDFQRTVTCFHEDDDDQHAQSGLARSSLRGRPHTAPERRAGMRPLRCSGACPKSPCCHTLLPLTIQDHP